MQTAIRPFTDTLREIRNGDTQEELAVMLNQVVAAVRETGKVGGEYIKTYGHYHVGKLDETYWIIQGEGIVLLQKRKDDKDDEIEVFYAISVKAGAVCLFRQAWVIWWLIQVKSGW